ncbi:MAG: LysR family transcriptional regulator [Chthoniobacteraceae bacterium]|nr:LysR family transcriptional regulator [Chthoniobacteraceae bacterium]
MAEAGRALIECAGPNAMNIHHLELFYYVARHGGITEAVRNMPYGVQQPAVSGQVLQLEETLGTKLFNRRPFQLSATGVKLYEFIEPFFSHLENTADSIRGSETHLRIGASTAVLRDHLPSVLRSIQKKVPRLRLTLHEGIEPDLLGELEKQEIDVAVTSIDRNLGPGFNVHELMKLPLVLLVPSKSPIKKESDLWKSDKIEAPLITPPPGEALSRSFQRGLFKHQVDWLTSIRVNSLELIETYVQNGFGVGLSVRIPGRRAAPHVRIVPLNEFEPISLCAVWRGRITPPLQLLVDELSAQAASLAVAAPV